MPYIEQAPLYNQVASGGAPATSACSTSVVGAPVAAGGPCGWCAWSVWDVTISSMLCPSDDRANTLRETSYGFCMGDQMTATNSGMRVDRGVFGGRFRTMGIRDVVDGTSNTIAMGEHRRMNFGIGGNSRPHKTEGMMTNLDPRPNPGACLATVGPGGFFLNPAAVKGRFGTSIWDGQTERCVIHTVLPPNSPSCAAGANVNQDDNEVVIPPSSRHTGGVQVLLVDGSVRFISENIDTGNLTAAEVNNGPSPYGVWGALGTRAGGETVGDF